MDIIDSESWAMIHGFKNGYIAGMFYEYTSQRCNLCV